MAELGDASADEAAVKKAELAQRAKRIVATQRHQRSEVTVLKRRYRLAVQRRRQMLNQVLRLLVRDLSGGRQWLLEIAWQQAGAIAERLDVWVAARLQRAIDDELVAAGSFKAVQVGQKIGRLDAGRPDRQRGVEMANTVELKAVRLCCGDAGVGHHLDAEFFKALLRDR